MGEALASKTIAGRLAGKREVPQLRSPAALHQQRASLVAGLVWGEEAERKVENVLFFLSPLKIAKRLASIKFAAA